MERRLHSEGDEREPEDGDPFGRFLKVRDVAASVGLSRAMIYRLMNEGEDPFPAPVKVGSASLWVEKEIVAWKAGRVRSRGAGAPSKD